LALKKRAGAILLLPARSAEKSKFNWLDWMKLEMHGTFITYPERESVPEILRATDSGIV